MKDYEPHLRALLKALKVPDVELMMEKDPSYFDMLRYKIALHQERLNYLFERYVVGEALCQNTSIVPPVEKN